MLGNFFAKINGSFNYILDFGFDEYIVLFIKFFWLFHKILNKLVLRTRQTILNSMMTQHCSFFLYNNAAFYCSTENRWNVTAKDLIKHHWSVPFPNIKIVNPNTNGTQTIKFYCRTVHSFIWTIRSSIILIGYCPVGTKPRCMANSHSHPLYFMMA